ncbi:MAG TPA: hypothetical protein DCR31_03635, partial [Ruminococcaceae bacterium]|nr:hypothetical protein [Oscillospiraceae bacterium]
MSAQKISVVDENRRPSFTIVMLAWPVFVEQILVSLVSYVDTAMVGSMGANATAAVSISNSPNMLVNGTIMAIGVGFTAMISRAIGAEDLQRAKDLMRQALLVVVSLGLPLMGALLLLAKKIPLWMGAQPEILSDAAIYNRIIAASLIFRTMSMIITSIMRGYGDTKTPMFVNIGVNIVNVIGNFLLIYPTRTISLFGLEFTMIGAGWGVAGAGAATSGSATLGALIMLAVIFLKKGPMQLTLKGRYLPDWAILKTVFRISLPAAFERIAMSSAGIITTSTIATLGTVAVAANSLYLTAEGMCFMPGFAFATAATTLVGQSLGAKRPDLAEKYVKMTAKIAGIVMFFMSVMLYVFASPILRMFTPDLAVIALGTICLQYDAFIQVPQMLAQV